MINEYERVTDTLIWFNRDVCLRFNVQLASKDVKGNRKFFYKEWKFDSKYRDTGDVVSVKRDIRSFLTIDNIRDNNLGIMIERGDLPMLRAKVNEAASWITSRKDVFGFVGKDRQRLQVMADVHCEMNVGNRSGLMFEPIVLTYENSSQEPGIRMSMGDTKNFVDISVKVFMDFYELLRTFDMYGAACAVIASLPFNHKDAEANRNVLNNIGGKGSDYGAAQNPYPKMKNYFDT